MENVIIVSADGHAVMPPDMWSHYLETRHHDSLPMLEKETKVFTGSLSLLNDLRLSPAYDIFDKEGLSSGLSSRLAAIVGRGLTRDLDDVSYRRPLTIELPA